MQGHGAGQKADTEEGEIRMGTELMTADHNRSRVRMGCLVLALMAASIASDGGPRQGGAIPTLAIGPGAGGGDPIPFDRLFDFDLAGLEDLCASSPPPSEIRCNLEGGLDHVVAGKALRNLGAGHLVLSGVPPGAEPVSAWLYWAAIDHHDPLPEQDVLFEGIEVVGQSLGIATEPCWGVGDTLQAYRASVVDLIREGINGEYALEGVPSSRWDGASDWHEGHTAPMAEGASLVVVYSAEQVPADARVIVHDGIGELEVDLEVTHDLAAPLPTASFARHSRIGADGQAHHWDHDSEPEALTPICTTLAWGEGSELIRGSGSLFDPSPEWQGIDGGPAGRPMGQRDDPDDARLEPAGERWGP